MMLGLDQPTPPSATPPPGLVPPGMEDDPMMRMLMQMLGGGASGGASNPFGMPFPQAPTSQPGDPATVSSSTTPVLPTRSTALYRLLHTLVALCLGLYIALYTPFTGTKLSRDRAAAAAAGSAEEREQLFHGDTTTTTRNFFWAFATAEALLLTTRHLMDRGRSRLDAAVGGGGSGVLGLVVGFLPPGVRSKVELAMRYGEVLGTVRRDVLVCVFVLGVAAWWRG